VILTPFAHSVDGQGPATIEDLEILAADVVEWMERTLEPFDVNVEIIEAEAGVDTLPEVATYLDQEDADINAYVFVQLIDVNGIPGEELDFGFGAAANSDVFAQVGNKYDEAALALPNVVANAITAAGFQVGTLEYNERLARGVASAILHESFHTFSFVHHGTGPIGVGDVMTTTEGFDVFTVPSMVTRFDVPRDTSIVSPPEPNGYLLAVEGYHSEIPPIDIDAIFGRRDSNNNDKPDLAYVTGTGAHDRITFALDSPNVVEVTVEAFGTGVGQGSPIAFETYTINLAAHSTPDTEGTILIDASRGNDLIVIPSDVASAFRIRAGTGNDTVRVNGTATSALYSIEVQGEAGNDLFGVDFQNGDPLPLAGFNLSFVGGTGDDSGEVIEPGNVTRKAYFVDTFTDGADGSINGRADGGAAPDDQVTLRAAIQEGNGTLDPITYIFLPDGTNMLSVAGTGLANQGDFDISKHIKIIGSGAGLSVIDAGSLATDDRIFDVLSGGRLDLSRVTLTLGDAADNGGQRDGGAVRVQNGGQFNLDYSAIVSNVSGRQGNGGGVYFAPSGIGSIKRSVITVNTADNEGGGVYIAAGSGQPVTIESTIIANNVAEISGTADIVLGAGRTLNTDGHNRFTSVSGFTSSDYVGEVDYVVTSVVDMYAGNSNPINMTIRDAIHRANITAGLEEIWLPAWDFVLTIDREEYTFDTSVEYGDLDILDSLVIRGMGPESDPLTRVAWAPGITDKVFELLGDYNSSGLVDSGDHTNYTNEQGESGPHITADGNDDGTVEEEQGEDYDAYRDHLGNTFVYWSVDF
jgi:hypothetical protein